MSALPKTLVLNYVTSGVTPPRVRNVTFWTLMAMAGICLLSSVIILAGWFWFVFRASHFYYFAYSYGRSSVLLRFLEYFLFSGPGLLAIALFFLGIIQMGVAPPIRRARPWPTVVAMIAVVLNLICMAMASMSFFCAAFMAIVPIGTPHADPASHRWFFLPSIIALLLTLVSIDLFGFLRWIFRNPFAEKPTKKFIG